MSTRTRSKRQQAAVAEVLAQHDAAVPEIVFVDELPPNTRQNKWFMLMEPFTRNPGKWGRLPQSFDTQGGASALKHRLDHRKGNIKLPEGEWEFAHRQVEGKWYIFARYGATTAAS